MPTFLFLSTSILNLDNITSIDLLQKPNGDHFCDVWFSGGGKRTLEGEDYRRLLEFSRKHKAE